MLSVLGRCIDADTQVCAVIGNPVGHSFSPQIHNAAFEALGLNYAYVAFRVEDVGACLAGMRALNGFRGMSVTIPHKAAVMPHLDWIDQPALDSGSVNTVVNDGGRLLGYSTDGAGVLKAFEEAGESLSGRRVAMLGTGGACRAVAFAIARQASPERITILGRNAERAAALAADLNGKVGRISAKSGDLNADLAGTMATHDVVMQCTPLGMYPEHVNESCVPSELISQNHVIFDMVYRPLETLLIRDARAKGARAVLGIEMLVNQAAVQFELWTGHEAPRDVMRNVIISRVQAG